MANLKGWLNTGWEKISCTIIGNKVAVDVVPRDLDGGVIGGSDAPSHTVIVDENGPIGTPENPIEAMGTIGQGDYQIRSMTLNINAPISANAEKKVEINGVPGYLIKIIGFQFTITNPTDGVSGTHRLYVYPDSQGRDAGIQLQSNYNVALTWRHFGPYTITNFFPNDRATINQALQSILISPTDKLTVAYWNYSEATQTNNGTGALYYKLIPLLD